MHNDLQLIKEQIEQDIKKASETGKYDDVYLKYFSKTHGSITKLMKELPNLSSEQKQKLGPELNNFQIEYKLIIEQAKKEYEISLTRNPLIDLALPLPPKNTGKLHPTTQVIREMNEFFRYYGYSVPTGPEIETAEYNFIKLNLPEGHPATDLQDSLFINEPHILLRTHTSSIETRVLTEYEPPIRTAFPGVCYRNETPSATNNAYFFQYQGTVVDKGINIQHLMGTLENFHKYLFGDDIEIRFRYKYYPEVSPGLGVDIKCQFCKGDGCSVCKHRGWIEVLGSGMIHYNTLKMCGIDPEIYTGFAFGMGLDRLVMQKFGISDIRELYEGGLVYE